MEQLHTVNHKIFFLGVAELKQGEDEGGKEHECVIY